MKPARSTCALNRSNPVHCQPRRARAMRQDSGLCFTLCGTWAMLHARSRDRIRKNGKISGFGARAEAEGLAEGLYCRARRSWLDRQVGQPGRRGRPICGTGPNSRHGSYVRPLRDLPVQGMSVLIQATRRGAGSPRAPRFTCHKMGCGAIGMPRRASARVPHRVK
jgi:hypothetical protein